MTPVRFTWTSRRHMAVKVTMRPLLSLALIGQQQERGMERDYEVTFYGEAGRSAFDSR